jgi:Leucine-rich repeat (LRR) protein
MTWVTQYPETEPLVARPARAFDAYHEVASDLESLAAATIPRGTIWLSVTADRLVEARIGVEALQTVKYIRIHSRSLRYLDLPRAPVLEALELSCPVLERLPEAPLWPRLRSLYVKDAAIARLPATLGGARLKRAYLGGCHGLEALPQQGDEWLSVRDLNLYGCGLASLPAWFEALTALTHCNLSQNRLSDPDSLKPLWRCTSLKGLALGLNRLPSLPEEVGALRSLKDLSLGCNPIESLPEGLAGCTALEVLLISHTKLATIPPVLAALPRLKHVEVMGTPIRAAEATAFKRQHGTRTTFLTSKD